MMLVHYSIQEGYLRAEFPHAPMPYSKELMDKLFPGRLVVNDQSGKWVGVICLKLEWETYILSLLRAMEDQPGPLLNVLREVDAEYDQFLMQIHNGPFRLIESARSD